MTLLLLLLLLLRVRARKRRKRRRKSSDRSLQQKKIFNSMKQMTLVTRHKSHVTSHTSKDTRHTSYSRDDEKGCVCGGGGYTKWAARTEGDM